MNRRRFVAGSLAAGVVPGFAGAETDGFYVPAEEVPHERTIMQWPVSRQVYDDAYFLDMVQATIAEIANTIADFEPVTLLAGKEHHAHIRKQVSAQVGLLDISTEDLWARDAGPITVINDQGNRAFRHIQFNGWGNRQTHSNDGKIAERLAHHFDLPLLPSPLKGEAGGVEQDGHGLLIAHESSWVHPNRNPDLSKEAVTKALLEAYGAERLIWAPGVKDQDITDYHIDSLARLIGPGHVLINLPDDPDPYDPFHQAALETHDILKAAGLTVDVIPEPNRRRVQSQEFVASYANFYICNGAVISAQFGDRETDAIALTALQAAYPDREVIQLNTDPLGEIGGGIHCATHEIPAGT